MVAYATIEISRPFGRRDWRFIRTIGCAPKVTHVLATLSLKPGITREQIQPTMAREVRETVALYLDGKIEQWYSRGDGKGVVFLLNCGTVEEAKAILESLPLVKANFAAFEYMTLGPLNPLRVLTDQPAK